MKDLIKEINDVIVKHYTEYTTDDLNDIIIELLKYNVYTSEDSIQNLIDELENLIEEV